MVSDRTGSLVPRHPTAQRLLDAAIHAMDAEGEAGLRVDAVVAEAGVTIPVLYHHFGSREGLVRAAHVARLSADLQQRIDDFAAALTQVEDRQGLLATFDAVLAGAGSIAHDRFVRISVLGATYGRPDLQEEVAELQRHAWERLAELLEGPRQKGWIRQDIDLVAFFGWLLGLFVGRTLIDIQEGAMDPAVWDRYSREAIYVVLLGELPAD
jgi:AcrR family transcriptional regulator